MKKRIITSRVTLVLLGIGLGLLARMVLGVPEPDWIPARTIERPLGTPVETSVDIPLRDRKKNKNDVDRVRVPKSEAPLNEPHNGRNEEEVSGLVPPFILPGNLPSATSAQTNVSLATEDVFSHGFSHDPSALFEPHGEKVCASGCAASRHPTEKLTRTDFLRLMDEVTIEPMDRTNNALEALMYYGPQTRKWMEAEGVGKLDRDRAQFVWDELQVTHTKLSIRVTDENGKVRTWLDATRIPFDRRHVFDMKTDGVQPLVMSGTVKRVGLDHIWVRL